MVSLGCPKALVDSERILTKLRADGYGLSPWPSGHIAGTLGVMGHALMGRPMLILEAWDPALAAEAHALGEGAEFDAMVAANGFVEWAHVHGHRYGTSKKAIEERIAQGADVILEIDFQGALQIKRIFANAVLIFILPPSWEELRSRLERRGEDKPETIDLRLKNAAVEMAQALAWATEHGVPVTARGSGTGLAAYYAGFVDRPLAKELTDALLAHERTFFGFGAIAYQWIVALVLR